jgi:hypothetical protein
MHLEYCPMSHFPDNAVRAWEGAHDYYLNPQQGWVLIDRAFARQHLQGFLEGTADLVIVVKCMINTQASESLNALNAKRANKCHNSAPNGRRHSAHQRRVLVDRGSRAAVVREPLGAKAVAQSRPRGNHRHTTTQAARLLRAKRPGM